MSYTAKLKEYPDYKLGKDGGFNPFEYQVFDSIDDIKKILNKVGSSIKGVIIEKETEVK